MGSVQWELNAQSRQSSAKSRGKFKETGFVMGLSGFYGVVGGHCVAAANPLTQLSCCMWLTKTTVKVMMFVTIVMIIKRGERRQRCAALMSSRDFERL